MAKRKTKEQLLEELKIECDKIERMLTTREIDNNKKLSCKSTYINNFGSMKNVAKLIYIEYDEEKAKGGNIETYTDNNLIELLTIECNKKGRMLTSREIDKNRNIPRAQIFYDRFDSLKKVAELVGFEYLNDKYSISQWEIEVLKYIQTITNNEINSNDRIIIQPLELDIYINELKVAIECNGTYWHNINIKDKYYHISKTNLCKDIGITLIHINEHEWENNNEQIKKYLYDVISETKFTLKEDYIEIDNMKPINYINVEYVNITQPEITTVGRYEHWNCGSSYYKRIGT